MPPALALGGTPECGAANTDDSVSNTDHSVSNTNDRVSNTDDSVSNTDDSVSNTDVPPGGKVPALAPEETLGEKRVANVRKVAATLLPPKAATYEAPSTVATCALPPRAFG